MAISVSLNSLGMLKALTVMMQARGEALRKPETETGLVSVNVGAPTAPTLTARPTGQDRIVDVLV